MKEKQSHAVLITVAVVVLLLPLILPVLYFGAYYLTVERQAYAVRHAVYETDVYNIYVERAYRPKYIIEGKSVSWFFGPAHRLDTELRENYWDQ